MKPNSQTLLMALAVTFEATGTEMSEAAIRIMVADLSIYPEEQILRSLTRCRKEVKGRLSPADIISRIEDGRPGPEEAWAMMPRDESASVVWTNEMAEAWGVAAQLLREHDIVPARMAFLERYRSIVMKNRDSGVPFSWIPSLGTDLLGRISALEDAERKQRLPAGTAEKLLPNFSTKGVDDGIRIEGRPGEHFPKRLQELGLPTGLQRETEDQR